MRKEGSAGDRLRTWSGFGQRDQSVDHDERVVAGREGIDGEGGAPCAIGKRGDEGACDCIVPELARRVEPKSEDVPCERVASCTEIDGQLFESDQQERICLSRMFFKIPQK